MTPTNEGLSARQRDFDATDLDMIRRGDMLGPRLGQRVYDALDAKDKRIAELEERWADAKDEAGRAAGRELHAAAELSRAEQLLAEAEKAFAGVIAMAGRKTVEFDAARDVMRKIREHLKP